MARTTFTSVELLEFGRSKKKGGRSKWKAPLTQAVIKLMGWEDIPECYRGGQLSDDLAARQIEVTPNEEDLAKHSTTLDVQRMHKFEVVRRELEGKRGKGTELELHFSIEFADDTGCQKLERYMRVANKSKLRVDYEPAAVQPDLPGTKEDGSQMPLKGAKAKDTGCVSCNAGIAFEPSGKKHVTGEKCTNKNRKPEGEKTAESSPAVN